MVFQCTAALVTLATFDLEKLVIFYSKMLAIEPTNHIPNVYAEFQLPGMRLGIFKPATHSQEFQNSAQSKISLCLEVRHLENALFVLANLGYPPPGEIITASHGREIYAYDPDGNRLILHQSKIN